MNLEETLELFDEIVELCYQSENPRLIEVVESIYPDVMKSETYTSVVTFCQELQVVINEEEFLDTEEEIVTEIQEKIEILSE